MPEYFPSSLVPTSDSSFKTPQSTPFKNSVTSVPDVISQNETKSHLLKQGLPLNVEN